VGFPLLFKTSVKHATWLAFPPVRPSVSRGSQAIYGNVQNLNVNARFDSDSNFMKSPFNYISWIYARRKKIISVVWMYTSLIFLSKKRSNRSNILDFSLVAMSGMKIHHMTTQMVCQFCRAWDASPRNLIVVSDGTRSEVSIRKDFSFWKGNLIIADWEACLMDYSGDAAALRNFASRCVYGRKLAAILHYAKEGPVLFSDSDVLWHRPLTGIPTGNGVLLKMCEDFEPSYNQELIAEMAWDHLLLRAPMNVGVVYLSGDLVKESPWFDMAIRKLDEPYKFPEQTILAAANHNHDHWTLSEVHIRLDDLHQLFTKRQPWAARHYVACTKRKFWRDATLENIKSLLPRK
jgi:hypothetical protein